MSEIKPCPFCGGEAATRSTLDTPERWFGLCLSCEAMTGYSTSQEGAAIVWNRRPVGDRLRRVRTSMVMLQQHAEGCAQNHYGNDHETFGLPGWLADTKADLEALTAMTAMDESAITDQQINEAIRHGFGDRFADSVDDPCGIRGIITDDQFESLFVALHRIKCEPTMDEIALVMPEVVAILRPERTDDTHALREALAMLEHCAREVNRIGARTGSQWFRLSGALINARAALATLPNNRKPTPTSETDQLGGVGV